MSRPTRIPEHLTASDDFAPRHLGPSPDEQAAMLAALGHDSLDALTDATVPEGIRLRKPLALGERLPLGEHEMLEELKNIAADNQVLRSLIGMGYHDTITPPIILRNVLENPGWYTQYTPYQAEISQGRLEALVNFQTMVADLTGLPLANASLLDEATAAAEAMHMCVALADEQSRVGRGGDPTGAAGGAGAASPRGKDKRMTFWADAATHPQTLAVLATRCEPIGVTLKIGDRAAIEAALGADVAGVLLSYPTTDGILHDDRALIAAAHAAGARVAVATDLLALTVIVAPGELGADIAIGSAQRFGVPMGFGGPHAAFMSARDDFRRIMPGRIIGVSRDAKGRTAYRLALQTREQHIRREKATSNICTAQVLLAVIASMYGVYHGPDGLTRIARRVRGMAAVIAAGLSKLGHAPRPGAFFDTLRVDLDPHVVAQVIAAGVERGINLRRYDDGVGIACDEKTTLGDVHDVLEAFVPRGDELPFPVDELAAATGEPALPEALRRTSAFMTHPTFHIHRSEHEMLRYLCRLEAKDLSLTTSMIPLGSCTMKLNATTEMIPVTWPEIGGLHPYAPPEQWGGYKALFEQLEAWLGEITGFPAVSLQPNSGAQGEYAGLLAIRGYHKARGQGHRTVCLIPTSAHGTNPASAVMAGMQVVAVASAPDGTIDLVDLEAKAALHAARLSALMVTYPSTHGVFEEGIREVCGIVHRHGGRVYMDGANMNAQVGLTRPAECGADVCHLNLHKTFCVSAGTPVGLSTGVARPIEQMTPGRPVYAWSDSESGVRGANLDAVYLTGRKACVQVTMQDGRTITCTPDHRVLTADGWVEAGKLAVGRHRVVVGPELPVDDPLADTDAERAWHATFGGLELAMRTRADRDRTLAFFRLLGAVGSDGTYCQESATRRRVVRVNFGTRYDARHAVDDIELLTGARPTISRSRTIYSVRFPAGLTAAVAVVPGLGEPGKRVASDRALPDLVVDPGTPRAAIREFLGALFGGDGCAPVILHFRTNPPTLKSVRYTQMRTDPAVLATLQDQLCAVLARFGVVAMGDRIVQPRQQRGIDAAARPRWRGGVTVVDGLEFAERIGFRYCAHKTARLSAASAFWRMKRTAKAQRVLVAERALARVPAVAQHHGPTLVWKTAVEDAYAEVAATQPIVSAYYASFAGTSRVSKQSLRAAIDGAKGTRPDLQGVRRTNRRVLAAPVGRDGTTTGVPSVVDFLEEIGAAQWFNTHHARGTGYSVQYATSSQEVTVEPTFNLAVTDVRAAGDHVVYDLTVDELHSFVASGVVVHNCIPHGGGGPGMGPIACVAELAPYLPGHPLVEPGRQAVGPVSAAAWGSASILPISFAYIAMMGPEGLRRATQIAILNANYIAHRLSPHFPLLFAGRNGRVAHELILDARGFKKTAGIEVEDIAKRLMDYGFHAPTMSFPVPGTLMIEPTESESKAELDRFCEAMIAIRGEIRAIEDGKLDRANNPLKNAPHTAAAVAGTEWDRPYSREQAAFPAPWLREHKYWPPVARVDNAYGDRNLMCTCPPMEDYA